MKQSEERERAAGRTARVLRHLERTLLASGLLLLVAYASACAHRELFQASESHDFDRAVAEAIAIENHDQTSWSKKRVARFKASHELRVAALGRLEVPSAGISVMLLEGTEDGTLDRAVGRIEGTARPGEPGNLGIAGHRDGFFRGLRHVQAGDEVRLATLEGVRRYEISEIRIVQPEDVSVLDETEQAAITLVTCYPFYYVGSAPQRYVVRAYETDFEPWSEQRLAEVAASSPGPALSSALSSTQPSTQP